MEQADIASHLSSLSLGSVTSYVCGPPPMIDTVSLWLRHCGVQEEHIHTEKWW